MQPASNSVTSVYTGLIIKDAISLRFRVTDPDGLHQAQLLLPAITEDTGWGPYRLFDCQRLDWQNEYN